MSNWKWHFVWAAALTGIITAIAYNTAQYNIEAVKQDAFMMKACMDAGGSWEVDWRTQRNCKRPGS